MKQLGIIILILLIIGGGVFLYVKTKNNTGQMPSQNQNENPSITNSTGSTVSGTAQTTEIPLIISAPGANTTVNTSTTIVSGKTAANANVSVNDQDIKADTQGNFSVSLPLDEGENTIDIVASDQNGSYAEKEITITLQTENTNQ